MLKLTLVSRSYCHLCDEMDSALEAMRGEVATFSFEVLDIDTHPELLALYDELVPVLLHGKVELCHYFLDTAKVRDYLGEIG